MKFLMVGGCPSWVTGGVKRSPESGRRRPGAVAYVAGRLHGDTGSSTPHVYAVGVEDGGTTAVGDGVAAVWAP